MKMVAFSFFFCLLHLGGEVDAVLWKSAGTKPGLSLPSAQNKLNFARELRFYQLLTGERSPAPARNEGEESDVVPIVSHDEEVDLEDDDDAAACRKHAAWRQTLQANAWRHVEDAFFRLSSLEQKEVLRKKRWLRKTLLRRLEIRSSGLQGLVSSSTSPCADAGSFVPPFGFFPPGRGTGRDEAEIRQRHEKLEELGRSMAHGGDAGCSSGEVGERQLAAPGDGDEAPEGEEIEMFSAGAGKDRAEGGAEAHDVAMKEAGAAAAKTNVEQREQKEVECSAAGKASPPTTNKKIQQKVVASKTTELPIMPIKEVAPRTGTSGAADAHSNANSTSTRATLTPGCRFAVLRGDEEDSDSDGRESDLEPAATTALDQRAGVPEPDPEPKGSSSSGNGGGGGEGCEEEGVDGIPDKLLTCDGMPLMLAKLMRDWGIYMEPKSWEEIKEVLTGTISVLLVRVES
eukprot:g2932.t1